MKKKLGILAIPLAISLISGCSSVGSLFGMGSSGLAKVPEIRSSFKPLVVWKQNVGRAFDSVFIPAVGDGAVYAASHRGAIEKFDARRGERIWKVDTLHTLATGVGLGENIILVGAENGEVLAFDKAGKPLWHFSISGELLSPPEASDGVVVVRSADGRIFGLDEADGKQKWVYQYTTPALSVRSYAGVTIYQGAVFAGFAGGKLAALDLKTGNVGWESAVSEPHGTTELERIADITSLPIVDELQVCAVAYQGRLACFDISKGETIWARDISSGAGMVVSKRNIFVSDDQDDVLSLDSTTGATIWRQDGLKGRKITAPYVQDSYVAVGDAQGFVYFLKREDGSLVAKIATDGSPILSGPTRLDSDVFLVQTQKGGLYALAAP